MNGNSDHQVANGPASSVSNDKSNLNLIVEVLDGSVLEMTVHARELVGDLKLALLEMPTTALYLSYHLEHDSRTISDEESIGDIEGIYANSRIKLVKDCYNEVKSRAHVQRCLQVLYPLTRTKNFELPKSVLAYTESTVNMDPLISLLCEEKLELNSKLFDYYFSVESKQSQSNNTNSEVSKYIKSINYSSFNPVSRSRLLFGDLFYLNVEMVDDTRVYVVTCSVDGFYVNKTSGATLNPQADDQIFFTFPEVIFSISENFKNWWQSFKPLEKYLDSQRFEEADVMYAPISWIGHENLAEYQSNAFRSELDLMGVSNVEFAISGQVRNWNEDLQLCREMPKLGIEEALSRERTWHQIHAEFVDAATSGVISIVHGNVPSMNQQDCEDQWIFIHNGIFFTQVKDVRKTYANARGSETLVKIASKDLIGLRKFMEADPEDLYCLDTVLINYLGKWYLAHTIIPGLLRSLINGTDTVVYGSLDGSKMSADPDFHRILSKYAQKWRLKEHNVAAESDTKCTFWTASNVKGVLGQDSRRYMIDFSCLLFRDGNFSTNDTPDAFYRPELIENYNQINKRQQSSSDTSSSTDEGLSVSLNPDLFLDSVKLADDADVIENDKKLNCAIGSFLLNQVLPSIATAWSDYLHVPDDTLAITDFLHASGVNMRYLGALTRLVGSSSSLIREMIVRSAKIAYRRHISAVPAHRLAHAVSHFLNAFFDHSSPASHNANDSLTMNGCKLADSHVGLWIDIRKLVQERFDYHLPENIPDYVFSIPTLRALCIRLGIRLAASNYDLSLSSAFSPTDVVELVPIVKHVTPPLTHSYSLFEEATKNTEKISDHSLLISKLEKSLVILENLHGPMSPLVGRCYTSMATKVFPFDTFKALNCLIKATVILERIKGLDHYETISSYENLARIAFFVNEKVARVFMCRALYLGALNSNYDFAHHMVRFSNLASFMTKSKNHEIMKKLLDKSLKMLEHLLGDDIAVATNPKQKASASKKALHFYASKIYHLHTVFTFQADSYEEALVWEKKSYNTLLSLNLSPTESLMLECDQWLKKVVSAAVKQKMQKLKTQKSKSINGVKQS